MGQTLSHGVYLPAEGERNCYSGLASNWNLLDTAIGDIDGKASATHTHGNITNDGKVGTTANKPLITGTGGAVQAGSFGTSANTFCEGNDSRLSDARTPLSHTHTKSDITDFPVYGTTAGTICEGNDSRLSDARTPVAHTHTKSDVTDLLNSNFIPSANNSYDLGSSSYQWNNIYSKGYYYNGVAWGLDKYNWWSLAQFYAQNSIHVRNVEPGVVPASNITAGFRVENANASYAFCDVLGAVNTNGTTYVHLQAVNKFSNGALNPNGTAIGRSLQVGLKADGSGFIYTDCGWRNNLIPHAMEQNLSLGTPTNRWKSLNGVNPGALGLPNMSSGTGVSLSAGSNSYSPPSSGWLSINLTGAISVVCGNFCHSGTDMLSVPVVKGSTYTVTVATSGTAYLFVSQGNV